MLSLDGLVCGYGQFVAVHELSLVVPTGTVHALLGANGAGKSSTILALAGHVQVLQGTVRLAGEDITCLPVRERVGRGLALVPEGRRLFPDLTVAENLEIGGYSLPRARSALNRARVLALFPRLADRLRHSARLLSGGEQQMLAIGRALMPEPSLLLIDEVSLGLMPRMVDICYEAIADLKGRGLTILLVEQNTARALTVADQVTVLESGRSVWQGTAEEARADPSLIDAYLGLRPQEGDPAPRDKNGAASP